MDPHTGEVLAMASVPSYNPNETSGSAEGGARNRAITDAFEPGSTMKTFTIASALDAGVVRPDDRFDCLMGRMMVGKYTIHDTHPHGILTVAEVFKFSSNIGATKIARRLGRDRFAEALDRFGFGRPAQIGLPGERGGVIRPVERWGDIGFANISFGQGLTVTPLQMVSGVSAIASGGVYHPPRILSRIVSPDGGVETPAVDVSDRRVMSEAAARAMSAIMRGPVEAGGTAKQAAIDGYPVAGKTGTAQKVSNGHYDPDKWVSSFVGFAPANDPRLAVIVIVDEPQGGHLGGAVAAPIFKEITEQSLRYLHVPPVSSPSTSPGRGGRIAVAAAATTDADDGPGNDLAPTDLPVVYTGEAGDAVTGDDPGEWDEIAGMEGPRLDATPGAAVLVPDFSGMSLAAAIRAARRAGVELAFDAPAGGPGGGGATGVAIKQKPAPGTAARGTLCRVAFGRRE
jgi:cell division protein FtsI (penicillin-binding protein 3)